MRARLVRCTGEIDRKKLGEIVFQHPELRKQLNAATHPLVIAELAKQLLLHWLLFHFVVVSAACGQHHCNWLAAVDSDWPEEALQQHSAAAAEQALQAAEHLLTRPPMSRYRSIYNMCVTCISFSQVVDVPLLFEGGLDRFTSMNITVACDADTQLRRLMARDSSQRAAAEARIAAQVTTHTCGCHLCLVSPTADLSTPAVLGRCCICAFDRMPAQDSQLVRRRCHWQKRCGGRSS